MDTRDGRIYVVNDEKDFARIRQNDFMKPMVVPPTQAQLARKPPKVGRNEPCPCGSGKKFKKCCLNPQPQKMRRIEVFRNGEWITIGRLVMVKAGERFRMFESEGEPVKDKAGNTEWIAAKDGSVRRDGVGTIEVLKEKSQIITCR